MDRQYKAEDTVRVFATLLDDEPVRTVKLKPISYGAMDYYVLDGVTYAGYRDGDNPFGAKIFLDRPWRVGTQ